MPSNSPSSNDWNLVEACGGEDALLAILTDFYDAIFDDLLIGFFFAGLDKAALVSSQFSYVTAHLGDRSGTYEGRNIRALHAHLPILSGHFDRRHALLKQVLDKHQPPQHVQEAWLTLDESLRDLVINTGAAARDRILSED